MMEKYLQSDLFYGSETREREFLLWEKGELKKGRDVLSCGCSHKAIVILSEPQCVVLLNTDKCYQSQYLQL
jgi:hypothetical protein